MQQIINLYYTIVAAIKHWAEETLPEIFNDGRVIGYETPAQSETKDV